MHRFAPASSPVHRHAAAPLLGALMAFVLAGCTVPATQLLVSIDTDFFVPEELDTIRVRVLYASEVEGAPDEERDFFVPPPLDPSGTEVVIGGLRHEVRRTLDIALGPAGTLPFELSLVPADGEPQRVARIEAYGLRDGVVRAAGSVRTRFVRHRTTRVSLFVFVACDEIVCPPDATCGAGGACVPNEVEPSCLEDPRLCPDAPLPALDAGPGDAPRVCGDGVWDPRTEECDGTDDCCDRSDLSECGVPCRLLEPPPDPCSAPELLTGPLPRTVSGRFAGASRDRRSSCLSTIPSGREVVYAIDADPAIPLRVTLLSEGMTVTVSPECPAAASGAETFRGACAGPRRPSRSVPSVWIGEGPVDTYSYGGRLYLLVDEAVPSDYGRGFSFVISEAPRPLQGTGTCTDPYVVPGSLLLGIVGSTPDNYAAEDISADMNCAGAAGADLWVALPDPFAELRRSDPDLRTSLLSMAASTNDEVVWIYEDDCSPTSETRCFGALQYRNRVFQQPGDSPRIVVDGILPETSWIGVSFDASF